mmetsp:Transcript_58149/g.71082  ORF Transcript_58149/g.71082 Transcript_58149/m.71082 type:complete len:417 (+) Transcript_58149:1-1251(+)
MCTSLSAKGGRQKPKKKKPHYGPTKLKSGYWQQDVDIDDDIDIFEWINPEDLLDDPPASVRGMKDVARFTIYPDSETQPFDAPEYRQPPPKLQLAKGLKDPPLVDQCLGRSFTADLQSQMSDFGNGFSMENVDVLISLQALSTMLAFVDGTLTEDMRAKGLNTRKGNEPERIDLFRVGRLPDAPNAVSIGTVWNWVPENARGRANFNKRSYDVNFEHIVTGRETIGGPPSIREVEDPGHYRILSYSLGDLNILVRAELVCTMPAVDDSTMPNPGMTVECSTANYRDAGDLWGQNLASKFAEMQLGNIGMLVRGIVDKGFLVDVQELTQEDLKLDRFDKEPLEKEAEALLGRVAGLLKRIKDVAECPGCVDRVLYLQYCDGELRIISPWSDEELAELENFRDVTNEEVQELVFGPES